MGSGFIYSKSGYIITNAHVVDGAIGTILITMWDSTKKLAVVDSLDTKTDIAVLKLINLKHDEEIPVAKMGCSGIVPIVCNRK